QEPLHETSFYDAGKGKSSLSNEWGQVLLPADRPGTEYLESGMILPASQGSTRQDLTRPQIRP
ncbi:MAG TPA: hypothetical protein PLA83_12330, partial [Deltaproteobacteria bacterium]|nr:hypothetical protein [Deltaproteobacteria bacterium]